MLQPREMMNVKIKKIFIFIAHLLKKNIYSKNLHNQEHYNIVITALASRAVLLRTFRPT